MCLGSCRKILWQKWGLGSGAGEEGPLDGWSKGRKRKKGKRGG